MQSVIFAGIGAFCTLIGTLITAAIYSHNRKKELEANGERTGGMMVEMGYIKSGIDDIKGQLRRQDDLITKILERLTVVEESTKQAHKRLDRCERSDIL